MWPVSIRYPLCDSSGLLIFYLSWATRRRVLLVVLLGVGRGCVHPCSVSRFVGVVCRVRHGRIGVVRLVSCSYSEWFHAALSFEGVLRKHRTIPLFGFFGGWMWLLGGLWRSGSSVVVCRLFAVSAPP